MELRFPSYTVRTVAWFSSAILYGVTRTCVAVPNRNQIFRSRFQAHRHMHGSFTHYSTALLLTAGLKCASCMYQIFMHLHIAYEPCPKWKLMSNLIGDALEIHDRIMFDFFLGLPHNIVE